MFDVLDADIVVMQETKIQRKDLRDDMVLVPGWDCFFSLPKHKKGYSGVAIYTRQSRCAPIRAEEGITGILTNPNSSISYRDLPKEQRIGGYLTAEQLEQLPVEAATLDSEGRCLLLEFPVFVLIGVYSPANRDDTRDDFRLSFVNALDFRIRNLIGEGKQVFLTGDINISRDEIDAAHAEEALKKHEITADEFVSTPARRIFNQLLIDGKVVGDRDEGREKPMLWDICRGFHPGRRGMYTCWEQKVNARPGNYGARIDYVLCSTGMKDWFYDANIQEGLMGSDHCPVYATMKDKINVAGQDVDYRHLTNPPGIFENGQRLRELTLGDSPPLSGRLITEFNGRRSIRDMFARKPSSSNSTSTPPNPSLNPTEEVTPILMNAPLPRETLASDDCISSKDGSQSLPPTTSTRTESPSTVSPRRLSTSLKRSASDAASIRISKRNKSTYTSARTTTGPKGQQSLKGFFVPKPTTAMPLKPGFETNIDLPGDTLPTEISSSPPKVTPKSSPITTSTRPSDAQSPTSKESMTPNTSPHKSSKIPDTSPSDPSAYLDSLSPVHDPIVSKESWSKLFTKPPAPRCESHDEPCMSMLTKKSGVNCGRSFWMCSRPLGPTGQKERGTRWRCGTFIWASDSTAGRGAGES